MFEKQSIRIVVAWSIDKSQLNGHSCNISHVKITQIVKSC